MFSQSIYRTYRRYRTLQTHQIQSLPIVILMPHSACNCRCIMCDIWKGNQHLQQLTEKDIKALLTSLRKLETQQVVMSGGEALLNSNFFRLCEMLKKEGLRITLLSTGLTLARHAARVSELVDNVIVSIDGDEETHDRIRNVSGAFQKLRGGVEALRAINPEYRITGRSVIHRLNFKSWHLIIDNALEMGLNQVSFLPADISSHAFNRQTTWGPERQAEVAVRQEQLPELELVIQFILQEYREQFENKFIAESPEKFRNIHAYYAAIYGLNPFPYKKCNAPWVSAVVEADGTVRPCFFHEPIGNIRKDSFNDVLNSKEGIHFRKTLNMDANETCKKCVCYLNLPPYTSPA